ncbi:MAG TPA: glycosyltransferase family 2 protein [Solirubrobacteraceae bacterium]|jgi:succinoglycan biosynthesis protein ExoM|nr:glycosyltransferase family 2 protein [Solirubrobacteraceae bacterium]
MTGGKIMIGIATGGRPEELRRLLTALATDYGSRSDVWLLVADNDEHASSRAVFEECGAPFDERRAYVHEPKRGYAAARNAVIRNVDGAQALALIDDDEVPEPGWLNNLLAAQHRTGADVVAGPVISVFPPQVPDWYETSGVFAMESPDFPEGHEMPWCATNNTLVMPRVLEAIPEGFDDRFNPMSGEDSHFFLLARRRGCRLVWTQTAVVREYLQPTRFNRGWIFKRATRSGNTRALIELQLIGGARTAVARIVKALGLLAFGFASAAGAGMRRDRALGLRAIHRIGLGYGMVLAFLFRDPWKP